MTKVLNIWELFSLYFENKTFDWYESSMKSLNDWE